MIAIVFLLGLLAVTVFAAATGAQALPIAEILMLVSIFVLFFGSGVYIAAVLGILGVLVGFLFSDRPWWAFMGQTLWAPSSNFVLVAVPLFLLMGEILLRAGLSDRLYRALNVWLNRMPGGLLHTNIISCAVFSAISGSSVATAATMGSVALPYFQGTKYSQRMVLGSLALYRRDYSFAARHRAFHYGDPGTWPDAPHGKASETAACHEAPRAG